MKTVHFIYKEISVQQPSVPWARSSASSINYAVKTVCVLKWDDYDTMIGYDAIRRIVNIE